LELVEQAKRLQDAGCFSIVLEAIPAPVADHITSVLDVPTIGIGAGNGCSGQVLVQQDMLGIYDRFMPKYVSQILGIGKISGIILIDAYHYVG
jgi:3-methyl-2-oxobutanoate hydroxymethyltransferase